MTLVCGRLLFGRVDTGRPTCSCKPSVGSSPNLRFHFDHLSLESVSITLLAGLVYPGNLVVTTTTSHPNSGRYFVKPPQRLAPIIGLGG